MKTTIILRVSCTVLCLYFCSFLASAQTLSSGGIRGKTWKIGATAEVQWIKQDFNGMLKILLWDGERGLTHCIASSISASSGRYSFVIPEEFQTGSHYRVRIEELEGKKESRMSNGYFSIGEATPVVSSVETEKAQSPMLSASTIHVYPNPANALVNIRWGKADVRTVIVHTMVGQELYSLNIPAWQEYCQIPTDQLPMGVYGISIIGNDGGIQKARFTISR